MLPATYRYRCVGGGVSIDGEPVYAGHIREIVRPEHALVIHGRGERATVELRGIEPLASTVRLSRSTN